jgi:L-threonylcarbamoyladenylate synthase
MVHRIDPETLRRAVTCLNQGGIIAYPTEGVYGLGCDPFNKVAVDRLLALKQRPVEKGLIMIAANWEQLQSSVTTLDPARMSEILATWPGPTTWVLPANPALPSWVRGKHESVAVRITAHPEAAALCKAFGKPLISTSANRQGKTPARDNLDVYREFGETIDYILPGRIGELTKPTPIYDGLTGNLLRG